MPETSGSSSSSSGSGGDVNPQLPQASSPGSKRPAPLSSNPRSKSGLGLEPLTPSAFAASTTLPIFMHPQQSYYLTPAPAGKQKGKKQNGSKEAGKTKSSSSSKAAAGSSGSSSSKKEGGGCYHDHGHEGHGHHHHHSHPHSESASEAEDEETGKSVSTTPHTCSGHGHDHSHGHAHTHAHDDDALSKPCTHQHQHHDHQHQHKQEQQPQLHFPPTPTQTLSPHHHKAIIDVTTLGGKPKTKWEAFRAKWLDGPSRPFAIMMLLTSVYLIAELAISVITGSIALQADSFHMLSDVMALGTAWWAQVLAKKGSCDKATFGWGRAEVIGALVNCAFVLGIAVEIVLSAAEDVLDWYKNGAVRVDDQHLTSGLMMYMGITGLALNSLGMIIFGGHHHHVGGNCPHSGHGHTHNHHHDCSSHGGGASASASASAPSTPHAHSHSHADGSSCSGHGHGHNHTHTPSSSSSPAVPLASPRLTTALLSPSGGGVDSQGLELPSSRFNDIEEGGKDEEGGEDGQISHSQTPAQTPTHRHNSEKDGKKKRKHVNLNIQATFLHLLGDALGSFGIILSGIIIRYGEPMLGKYRLLADPICGLVIVAIILFTTVPVLRQSCRILLNFTPKGLNLSSLRQELLALPHVLDVHALHVWTPSSGAELQASMHVIMSSRGAKHEAEEHLEDNTSLPFEKEETKQAPIPKGLTTTKRVRALLRAAGITIMTVQTEIIPESIAALPLPDGYRYRCLHEDESQAQYHHHETPSASAAAAAASASFNASSAGTSSSSSSSPTPAADPALRPALPLSSHNLQQDYVTCTITAATPHVGSGGGRGGRRAHFAASPSPINASGGGGEGGSFALNTPTAGTGLQ